VASVENLFENRRGRLLTVATLGAFVTLSGAFAVAVNALNLAYGATEGRSWIHRRLLGLAVGASTVIAGTIALALLVVGPLLGQGQDLADLAGLGGVFTFVWNVLRLPALTLGLVLWTATLLHIAPNRALRWRDALPGALLTTGLWLAASVGFHFYLVLAADANPVLGAFGGGVIVMIWVYLLSVALLLGGELNALRSVRRRSGDTSSGG
jgi:membrane protein